ncbi:MAG: TolC family protein [Treponema sp.]|nr:TolC family protein [Treponema sp.]
MYRKITALFLFCLMIECHAQTELELLWKNAETEGNDSKILELELQKAAINQKFSKTAFLPSFSISSDCNYSDIFYDVMNYPVMGTGAFSYSQPLPGGAQLEADAAYYLTRDFIDLESLENEDELAEHIGYNQVLNVTVDYRQSFLPFWIYGKKEPLKQNALLTYEKNINQYFYSKKNLSQLVANYYFQLRKIQRTIKLAEVRIKFYEEYLEYQKNFYENGQIAKITLWSQEDSFVQDNEKLLENYEARENLLNQLRQICPGITSIDENSPLPQVVEIDPTDYDLKNLEIEHDLSKNNSVYVYQSNAPSFGIKGVFSYSYDSELKEDFMKKWKEKGNIDWAVSLYLIVSFDNTNQSRQYRKNQKINDEIYNLNLNMYLKKAEEKKQNLSVMIDELNRLIEISEKNENRLSEYYEMMVKQCKKGICTEMELKQSKLQMENAKVINQNYKDTLWFYNWLIKQ